MTGSTPHSLGVEWCHSLGVEWCSTQPWMQAVEHMHDTGAHTVTHTVTHTATRRTRTHAFTRTRRQAPTKKVTSMGVYPSTFCLFLVGSDVWLHCTTLPCSGYLVFTVVVWQPDDDATANTMQHDSSG